jgi:hypothetical protein
MRKAILAAALLTLPGVAGAESLLSGWDEGSVTIYGWLPGITGAQTFPDGEPIVDLDTPSVLEMLDFAFFGAGEIRRDRVGLLFDVEYADLSQDGTAENTLLPNAEPLGASVGTKLLMSTGAVTWRAYEQERGFVDVYGGIRAFDVEVDFSLSGTALGIDRTAEGQDNWVDALVGVRAGADLGHRFSVTGLADVGGFGIGESSDLTWQVTGTLNYGFTERFAGRIGYRYMSIDQPSQDIPMDIEMYGPLIGVTWTF